MVSAQEPTNQVMTRLPMGMCTELDHLARELGISRNAVITAAIRHGLPAIRDTVEMLHERSKR